MLIGKGLHPVGASLDAEVPFVGILLRRRADDHHVCIDGHPEFWACGASPGEALGDLVMTHGVELGIVVSGKEENFEDAMVIEVCRRTGDWHAQLEGHSEIWGCSDRSERAAIGQLLLAHPEEFGLSLRHQ